MNDPTIRAMTPEEAWDRFCPLVSHTHFPCAGPRCMAWRITGVVRRWCHIPPSPINANVVMRDPPEDIEWPGEWKYDSEAGTQVYVETLISAEGRHNGYCGMVPPRVLVTQSDRE